MEHISPTTARNNRPFRVPFAHWCAVWRSRKAMARLEPHLLQDVGLSPADVSKEAERRFWDAPAPWRRRG